MVARVLSLPWATPVAVRNRNFPEAASQSPGRVEDARLFEAARRGDAGAFSGLFNRYQGPIFRYAAHMCGHDAADDIVQDTFLAVLRGTGQYDADRGPAANYLFGIARHFVLKRLSTRELVAWGDDPHDQISVEASHEPSVLDSLTRAETVVAVRAAIRSLPPAYREAIVLCELQDMSYDAAAAIAECPVGTIRSRLHRAKALLSSKLAAVRSEVGSRK